MRQPPIPRKTAVIERLQTSDEMPLKCHARAMCGIFIDNIGTDMYTLLELDCSNQGELNEKRDNNDIKKS
jgi:hypothetical protein